MPTQLDGLPEYVGVPAEMPLPEAVADYCYRSRMPTAVDIVIGGEQSSAHRRDTEYTKEIRADPQALGEVAFTARGQVEPVGRPGQRPGEGLLMIANLFPNRIREGGYVPSHKLQLDKPVRIFHGQRTQHYCVQHAENGGVCADAERQRENRRRCKSRIGSEGSQAVADILDQRLEKRPTPHAAARFGQ